MDQLKILPQNLDHPWHVWINEYSAAQPREKWPSSLYEFKHLLQALPWLGKTLGQERKGELPKFHQHCSHCAPECIESNKLICALGKECAKCPILESLRKSVAGKVSNEEADLLCGLTCAWHIFTTATGTPKGHFFGCDTSTGYLLDEGDRMFWDRLHENLFDQT